MTFSTIGRHSLLAGRYGVRAGRFGYRITVPVLAWAVRSTIGHGNDLPVSAVPAGRDIELPGGGSTYVVDIPGPRPDAPTVLLLHGIFTTGCLTWFSVLEDLVKDYRVVTLDQRWHGRGVPSPEFLVTECAEDAVAVLDALGIDRAIAVGYSMGGATAQILARRHPERLAGLVLCSTQARWGNTASERGFYRVLDLVNRRLLAGVADKVRLRRERLGPGRVDPADDIRAWALDELRLTSPWTLPLVLGELGRFDSTGWIGDVAMPTGMVITGRDRAIPTVRQRELAALLPDPVVAESPGGHASLVFDLGNWKPLFLEVVGRVADQVAEPTAVRA